MATHDELYQLDQYLPNILKVLETINAKPIIEKYELCVYGGFLREALRLLLNSRKSQLEQGTAMISEEEFEEKMVAYLADHDLDLLWTQPVDAQEFEQLREGDQQLDHSEQLRVGRPRYSNDEPEWTAEQKRRMVILMKLGRQFQRAGQFDWDHYRFQTRDTDRERNQVISQPENRRIIMFDRTQHRSDYGDIDYFDVMVYHFYLSLPLEEEYCDYHDGRKMKTQQKICEVQVTDVEDGQADESESNHELEYTINSLVLSYVTEEQRYVLHNRRRGMLHKHRERDFEVIVSDLEDIMAGRLVPVFDPSYPHFPEPLSWSQYKRCLDSYYDANGCPQQRTVWSKAGLTKEMIKCIRAAKYLKRGYVVADEVDPRFKEYLEEVKQWKDKCGK